MIVKAIYWCTDKMFDLLIKLKLWPERETQEERDQHD